MLNVQPDFLTPIHLTLSSNFLSFGNTGMFLRLNTPNQFRPQTSLALLTELTIPGKVKGRKGSGIVNEEMEEDSIEEME